MKTTKLEVIRINEDVIATSGEFCTDHRNHYYFTRVNTFPNPNEAEGTFYIYNNKWYKVDTSGSINLGNGYFSLNAYGTNKYYIANATNDGFIECTNHHNPSDAKNPN